MHIRYWKLRGFEEDDLIVSDEDIGAENDDGSEDTTDDMISTSWRMERMEYLYSIQASSP